MVSTRLLSAVGIPFLLSTMVTASAGELTLKFRLITHNIDVNVVEAPDSEGHVIGAASAKGSAVFEDGRFADKTYVYSFDMTKGVGSGHGYSVYSFVDGSGITVSFDYVANADGVRGDYVVLAGAGEYAGAEGSGWFESVEVPWQGASLYNGAFELVVP